MAHTLRQLKGALRILRGQGAGPYSPDLRPLEDIEAHEWARWERGQRTNDIAKLRALLPAWLKRHIAQSLMPKRQPFDYRMRLPRAGTYQGGYYFVDAK